MCALVTGVQTCALPICPSNRSTIMSQLSFSSFDDALLVRDAQGRYSPASVDQILEAARQAIELKMQRGAEFTSPALVKEYLRNKLAGFEHEVFAVLVDRKIQRLNSSH